MSDPTSLTLAAARDALLAKTLSARELTDAHLAAMEASRTLNAFIVETPEIARSMAQASDERIGRGEAGPLEGIPLGIKDLYCTKGVQTTAGSRILEGFVPGYESTVSGQLWRDGAVMLGKLNLDEFAMGSSNETSYFGPVVSPWRRPGSNSALVPGGSSGGSAAAVAARLCLGATATDTGGSIRQPAAFTGTVGIKPTYGRCSRFGIVAFASSLDQAGPVARTVRDAAILLGSMAGHDPKDTTSVDRPVPDYEAAIGRSVRGKVIGIPKEYRLDGMAAEIDGLWQQGIAWLKDAGASIVDISLPHTKYALPAYYIVAPAEASSNLARYDGVRYGLRVEGRDVAEMYGNTRAAGFGPEVRRRVMIGTYVLSAGYYDAYYLRAQKVRTLVPPGFRAGLRRRSRRDPHAGDAERGLRGGREGVGQSDRDVSQRRLHGDGEHGGPARHRGPGGTVLRASAARPAADRPSVRRGDAVLPGRGGRALGPRRRPAGPVVGYVSLAPAGQGVSDDRKGAAMAKTTDSKLVRGATGDWEIVVGMEIHAQVNSRSKLFSGAATGFGAEPNTQVSFVDAAMPGMLPVINEACIAQAVRTGLGLNAKINHRSVFDRKNYFYPDLPQGYQISQYKHPIVGEGEVIVDVTPDRQITVGIERLHLEQDAGKSLHGTNRLGRVSSTSTAPGSR